MTLYNNYLDLQPTGAGAWLQRQRALAEWRLIGRFRPRIDSVLEIGPGHGVFAAIVRAHRADYVAVESNRRIAASVAGQAHQVCLAFAPPLPFESLQFDLVYASHVIEHMPSPATALAFVQEAQRVLRPGGLLALAAPDLIAFGDTFWDADYTHNFPVTARRMRQLLSDAQLDLVELTWLSGPIGGPGTALLGAGAKLFPLGLFGWHEELYTRLERLRLTFLKNLVAIARKP